VQIATLRRSYRWISNPYDVLEEARRKHGLTFWMDLTVVGRVLVTGEPDLVDRIIDHPDLESGRGIAVLRTVLGDGSLITLDGEDHARRRRIVGPVLNRGLERLERETVRCTLAELHDIRPGSQVSVYDLARRVTLQTIVSLIFGAHDPDLRRQAGRLVEGFLRACPSSWILYVRPFRLDLGRLTPWGRARREGEQLRRFIVEQVQAARRATADPTSSILSALSRADDLSEESLTAEILALLLFGHDTSAATLAWAFAHVCGHPGTLARIRSGGQPFLEACLHESMRLNPVVVHVTRIARRDVDLGSHRVPAGTRVFASSYLTGRNEELFPEPSLFRPERFLDSAGEPRASFPFGLGARTCIGRQVAMRQMVFIMSTMIRHAEIELAPGYEARPVRRTVLMVPEAGTRVVIGRCREPEQPEYSSSPAA
jgi:cytochrome P450